MTSNELDSRARTHDAMNDIDIVVAKIYCGKDLFTSHQQTMSTIAKSFNSTFLAANCGVASRSIHR